MNPDSSKKIGNLARSYIIVRDLVGGIILSLILVGTGIAMLLFDHSGKTHGTAKFFLVLAPVCLIIVGLQLYLRLARRKKQSSNLAYQATDGDVAINRPSKIQENVSATDLENQAIKIWIGPVFSNQNTHISFGVDSTPNTENTLVVTEKYLIGLLIGPAVDSNSITTQVLNIIPIAQSEKNALGATLDAQAIRQNLEKQLNTNPLPQLVDSYGGFVVSLTEIETAKINDSAKTLNIQFRSGKKRSWVYTTQDDRLTEFYQEVQSRLEPSNTATA